MSRSVGGCMSVAAKDFIVPRNLLRFLSGSLLIAASGMLVINRADAQSDAASEQNPAAAAASDLSSSEEAYKAHVAKQQQLARKLTSLKKPLLAPDAEQNFNRNVSRFYRTLMTTGPNLSAAQDQAIMKQALEFRLFRAADPEVQASPQRMSLILGEVRRDLGSCGSQILNAQNKKRFREDVFLIAHDLLNQLLENNLDARSFALTVLLELETVSKEAGKNTRTEILEKVPDTLLAVLTDPSPEQPDAVRAVAAAQIRRYLQITEALPVVQMKLAGGLSRQLMRTDTEYAYQRILIDALVQITQPREVSGKPVPTVFETLLKVVSDRSRPVVVRCEAARGFGRVGYDPQIAFDPLAWKVAQLAAETGAAYNEAPENPEFSVCGAGLYLAFHHLNADEAKDTTNVKGMLNRDARSTVVKGAYEQILKIAGPLLSASGAPVPDEDLKAINDWVTASMPENLKYDANGTPVSK